jgi:integrase
MQNDFALIPNQHALELMQRAREYANRADAPNTKLTYESCWNDFCVFAERMKAPSLPAHPALVVMYLTELAPVQSVATLKTKLSAIRRYHEKERLPDPTQDPAVIDVMLGIVSTHGKPQRRKKAADRAILSAMLRVQPQTIQGIRNRALLLVGFAAALRRSELVALRVGDVEFLSDRMILTVRRSKTDNRAVGTALHIARVSNRNLCAVHALQLWLTVSKIQDGFIFRKIDRWENIGADKLTPQVVRLIVQDAAARANLTASAFAAHSLRRGAVTQAARNHETTGDIRKLSRHETERMVDVYNEDAADAQMRVTARLLED